MARACSSWPAVLFVLTAALVFILTATETGLPRYAQNINSGTTYCGPATLANPTKPCRLLGVGFYMYYNTSFPLLGLRPLGGASNAAVLCPYSFELSATDRALCSSLPSGSSSWMDMCLCPTKVFSFLLINLSPFLFRGLILVLGLLCDRSPSSSSFSSSKSFYF